LDEGVALREAFNATDDACRVRDIVTALSYLKQSGFSKHRLTAAQFAAAVFAQPVSLDARSWGFAGADADFVISFFVPGIQRALGDCGLRRRCPNRSVTLSELRRGSLDARTETGA